MRPPPHSITVLAALSHLYWYNTRLSNTLPELAGLTSLAHLHPPNVRQSGTLPDLACETSHLLLPVPPCR